jgi:hypothetical protein
MAKTGKRQQEGSGGGNEKKGDSSKKQSTGGGAWAGLELPGACVPHFVLAAKQNVDCPTAREKRDE